MSEETTGEVSAPEAPEVPKRPRKTLIAILLVVIVGISAVSVFIWWYTQDGEEPSPTPPEFNTYSKYGFSFEYPKGMSISEHGILESTATSGSGKVMGVIYTDDVEEMVVVVVWLTTVQIPNLEMTLDDEFELFEAEGWDIDRGQLVTGTKAGHEIKYQSFTAIVEGETVYGIIGFWYCGTNNRLYELCFLYIESNTLPKFQEYLDSFVCH